MKKHLLLLSAVVGIFCLCPTAGCNRSDGATVNAPERVRPVKALRLKDSPLESIRSFPCSASASREVEISFRVSGPLIKFNLETGEAVSRGQVLARIDPRDFEVRLKTLEAGLNASRAQKEEAQLQFRRYSNLIKEQGVAKAAFDKVKAAWETAEAQVEADLKNLEDARNALKDTVLKAPFSGFVNEVYVENHETVRIGQPIISLVDLSSIEVSVGIPEDFLPMITNITWFSCKFDSFQSETFKAFFKEVGKRPNSSNQTYPMTLILESPAQCSILIRPGMTGEVCAAVCEKDKKKAFVVPVEAVVNDSQRRCFVWVFSPDEQCVKKRYVNTGKLLNQGIEITGDINPGELVVTAGAQYLEDNQKVRILDPPSDTNVGNLL